jgi:hypothetical protein
MNPVASFLFCYFRCLLLTAYSLLDCGSPKETTAPGPGSNSRWIWPEAKMSRSILKMGLGVKDKACKRAFTVRTDYGLMHLL